MAIILDADVIIGEEKGSFDLKSWMLAHADEHFEIAAITVAELWHGVESATGIRRSRRELYVRIVLGKLAIIPYAETTAFIHARIWASTESSGKMIGAHDLIVAATALERGSAVATFNHRHFAQVQGLKIVRPS
jgi:tRNA(fMet)-specific endonuclease VapC